MVLFRGLKPAFKKINKTKIKPDLHPIRTADDLLNTKDNLKFVKAIKLLIKPSSRFNSFYLPIIKKFAEFVQNLTENQCGFFNQEIGFLERGLERSSRTLALCLKYFFPEEINFANISNKDALWIYATFTAALFLDIGKIAVKYSITLFHKKGLSLKKWNPYIASMLGQGDYYKFDYVKENFNDLRNFITPLLARQILDSMTNSSLEKEGFNWIASDPDVLKTWFFLLAGEEDRIPMTSFMSMIPRADIELIENARINAHIAITDRAGEAFLQWLRKELAEGRILINDKDAKIRITEGKILLSTAIFQEFVDTNPNYKHPDLIERQFIDVAKLYQISISELDQRYRAYGGSSGLGDLGKRYRTVGGLSATQENEKNTLQRFLQGDIRLISLITSASSMGKIINLSLPSKDISKIFISPHLSN
jgi:hypothetical protein